MKRENSYFKAQNQMAQYIYKLVESREYSSEEIDNQIGILDYMINKIKSYCKEGKSIDEAKVLIRFYVSDFLSDILRPSFYDFYTPRTMEYLMENEGVLRENVEQFILKKTNINTVLEELDIEKTENLDKNIVLVIATSLNYINHLKLIKDGKFKKIQEKIRTNSLSLEDINDTMYCIKKVIVEHIGNDKAVFLKYAKEHPEEIYKKFYQEINSIFTLEKKEEEKSDINFVLSPEYLKKSLEDKKMTETVMNKNLEIVKVKDFLSNPLYSKNKEENILVFIGKMAQDTNKKSVTCLCKLLKESGNDAKTRKMMIDIIRNYAIEHKKLNLKSYLIKRISKLVVLQEINGFLDQFNNKNNERLSAFNLDALNLSKEDLKKAITNLVDKDIYTTEKGISMSAFYANRDAKLIPYFLKSAFILEKNGIFEKIYKNPNISKEKLDIPIQTLVSNMAEYDVLSILINKLNLNQKLEEGGRAESKAIKEINKIKCVYERKYKNFDTDFYNVLATMSGKEQFYMIKNFSISALIYTAITNYGKNIVNWGYVPGDKNLDKEKVLIGFDVKDLNMPVLFHIDKEDLSSIVENITGKKIIPVYEGVKNFEVLKGGKRLTTQVLYPITAAQRRIFRKNEKIKKSTNCFIQHLKWLQNPKQKPEYTRQPGSREYDIEKGIISNKDEPNR